MPPQRSAARPRAPQAGAGLLPGPIAPGMLSTVVAVLSAVLGANEGDAQGAEALDAAPAGDAHLPPEDLAQVSVEAEIGGRSLAEIAAEACRVTGVAAEPEYFCAAPDGDAAPEIVTDATKPDATTPDVTDPDARQGDADAPRAPHAGPPHAGEGEGREPTHDPP